MSGAPANSPDAGAGAAGPDAVLHALERLKRAVEQDKRGSR
jgi:hypothetical protein